MVSARSALLPSWEDEGSPKGERERERKDRKVSSEGMAISYSHLEDLLNMHGTIAYLMQLVVAGLFSFSLYLCICLAFFLPFRGPLVYLAPISKCSLSLSSLPFFFHCIFFSLPLMFGRSDRFYLPAANARKTCSNQDAFVISAGRRHRCKLHFE